MIWIKPDDTIVQLSHTGQQKVVWVPSDTIGFHLLTPPKSSRKLWEKSVPYMLEDRLVNPLEVQHFVFGKLNHDGQLPVAVVDRNKMDHWLELLKRNNYPVQFLCPDLLAVPYEEGGMVMWHEDGRVLVRTGHQQGMVGSATWISQIFERIENNQEMRIFSDDIEALPAAWQSRAETLPGPLTDKMSFPNPSATGLNLLQGSYLPASPLKALIRPWRGAAAVSAIAFLLYISSVKVETEWVQQRVPVITTATQNLVNSYYPGTELRGNVRRELNRKLSQARKKITFRESSLWPALLQAESIISDCEACRVENVAMAKDKVTIKFSTSRSPTEVAKSLTELPGFEVQASTLPNLGKRRRMEIEISYPGDS